jgi:hypothetical protein
MFLDVTTIDFHGLSERRADRHAPHYSLRPPTAGGLVVPSSVDGLLAVPGPVPIVSPVVPLFKAPLLTPAPWLGRLVPFEAASIGLPAAGETAESPDVVVAPVLAFCANAIELASTSTDTAANTVIFISNPPSLASPCSAPG